MKLKILYLIIFIGTIFSFFACSDSIEFPDEPDIYESVAIVYWMGDNSLSSYAENDIEELKQGKNNIPTDCKIVIYADKINSFPVIYHLDAKNGLQVWKQFTQEEDCTDSLTLLNNLKSIVQRFPAKKYGLTFGSHGSGWVWQQRRALGPDYSHSDNYLNIPTLRGILEKLPHFSYIFFDVCFMQSIEVAYELRNETDWIIGSPAEIPSAGAPYHLITEALCNGDVFSIVENYDNYYPIGSYKGVLLSALDCSKLDNFSTTTGMYIEKAFSDRQTISPLLAQEIQKYSTLFSYYTYCYDMNSAMSKILPPEDYESWINSFNEVVPLRKPNIGSWTTSFNIKTSSYICNNPNIYDLEHFGGISMYFPKDDYEGNIMNTELQHYQWYKAVGWDKTGW